jgi:hypothetical protein
MHPLTKALCSAHVWTTALTTLFAGISPCQCVCPDGHRKLFCLGISFDSNACCCSGACCDSARPGGGRQNAECPRVKATKRRCCCCQAMSARGTASTADQNHIQGRGCKRTLSQAEIVPCPRRDSLVNDCMVVIPLSETPPPVLPTPTAYSVTCSCKSYHPPPPTDLVVVFQHFVI